MDTLKGLHKARECKFFDFKNFNIEEYEHFEKVENGDLSWCMDGKFIAFAGPHATRETSPGGYQTLCPENYVPYYKRKNVTLVIRLNKKYYDSKRFTSQGIDHCDLYFLDGSNPPPNILRQFIQRCEETRGAVAVHCKAGLGRTGCCIGCYMMKHFRFTAEEVIGWLRIVRPGSIIGPQQDWMREMEQQMWREGELFRARLQSLTPPTIEGEESTNGAPGDAAPSLGAAGRGTSGSRLAMSVRSGSNNQLLAAQAAAMAKEEECVSQGDQLRARRQMKALDSPGANTPGASSMSPGYQPSLSPAMSPLSRSGSRSLLNNSSGSSSAGLSSPTKSSSNNYSMEAPSTPTTGFYSAASAAPSPVQGAPQSPASPNKRKTTLGSFLGLS
jgi:cell division cycle 14